MAHEYQGRQLEQEVRRWLSGGGDAVRFVEPHTKIKSDLPDSDFLIVKPSPAAVFVMVSASPHVARLRSRRLLATRVALAERYGPEIPVVVVVPDTAQGELWNFADAVLRSDQLPELLGFLQNLKLNKQVQALLRDGDPGNISFSSPERVERVWGHSVAFTELLAPAETFPRGSLAFLLAKSIITSRDGGETVKECGNSKRCPSDLPRIGRRLLSNPDCPWILPRAAEKALEKTLMDYLKRECGGEVATKRLNDPLIPDANPRHLWCGSGSQRAIIRWIRQGPNSHSHKVQELVAEAWLSRASLKLHDAQQVLLLGSTGEVDEFDGIGRNSSAGRKFIPRIRDVNQLEAAGWKVFPCDFAEETPSFVKFLGGAAYV